MVLKNDLTGKRFHKLIVVKCIGNINHSIKYECKCDCGNTTIVNYGDIVNQRTKSCGCLKSQKSSQRLLKHGKWGTPEYLSWINMKQRCYNKKSTRYSYYGARGIKVCNRWRNSFGNFLEDMGKKPSPKYSIDRIDNNGDYTPGNCRWTTSQKQCRNKRNNRLIEYNGQIQSLAKWIEEINMPYHTVKRRLLRGWSVHRAFTEPIRKV